MVKGDQGKNGGDVKQKPKFRPQIHRQKKPRCAAKNMDISEPKIKEMFKVVAGSSRFQVSSDMDNNEESGFRKVKNNDFESITENEKEFWEYFHDKSHDQKCLGVFGQQGY